MSENKIELLAPAGDMEKLKTALHFGADAVYFAGKSYGLRAFSGNFDLDEIESAIKFVHSKNKKAYITLNILAKNSDFDGLKDYIVFLQKAGADAVIVSDFGVMQFVKKYTPALKIHVSTQANITNKYAAAFAADFAERVVLARELSLPEIAEIKDFVPQLDLEAFVHGAMCISYSGRCLISDYLANRPSNRGECAQSCRWRYKLVEESRDEPLTIEQDERGSYILNSKDLNMLEHLDKLIAAGVSSLKIEGRAKSAYYVGGVVNAYRRVLDLNSDLFSALAAKKTQKTTQIQSENQYICPQSLKDELLKISHRDYCTGFNLGSPEQLYSTSKPTQSYQFSAIVAEDYCEKSGNVVIEQRNRFAVGDELEIVSSGKENGKTIMVSALFDQNGGEVTDALIVQQRLSLKTDLHLQKGDLLRKKL